MSEVREIVARALKSESPKAGYPKGSQLRCLPLSDGACADLSDSILTALDAAGYVVVPKTSAGVPIEMSRGTGMVALQSTERVAAPPAAEGWRPGCGCYWRYVTET